MTRPARSRRTSRAVKAAALAMPLVTLAASPALAETAPSPTVSQAPTPEPVTPAAPTPTVTATPTPTPSVTESAPEVTPEFDVTVANAALAAAIQQAIIDDPAFRLRFIGIIQDKINTDPAFAASFRAEVQRRVATEPFFALTWKAGFRAAYNANFNVGETTWTGGAVRHPRGIAYYSQVMKWGELVLGVMAELNIDPYYFPGIMAQIQQESAGNKGAVNAWDSNAQLGYASMGLLQVIAPTYQTYAKPGYRGNLVYIPVSGTWRLQQFASPWQTYPYTNLYAALTYVLKRYGIAKLKSWNAGSNQGY